MEQVVIEAISTGASQQIAAAIFGSQEYEKMLQVLETLKISVGLMALLLIASVGVQMWKR